MFEKMVVRIAEYGFRCIELYGVIRRPGDCALW